MSAPRTRVKICGITRLEDAQVADRLGVDALGFVFVPASKRFLTPQAAQLIVQQLTSFVTVVGLFLNAEARTVEQALETIPGLIPQFHGQESSEYCDSFNRPYVKAMGVGSSLPTQDELVAYTNASAFLFDSNEPGALGGTGHAFEWDRLKGRLENQLHRPLILAGGIDVNNVQKAISEVRPYALDVSSGVESAKGIKSSHAMQQFMSAVAQADASKPVQEST